MNDLLIDIHVELGNIFDEIILLVKKLKEYYIVDEVFNQVDDVRYYIVKHAYRLHNVETIRCQKLMKNILNSQIKVLSNEYRFSLKVNTSSSFYSIILSGTSSNRYDLMYENGELSGVKLKEANVTYYQFKYFARKMEMFLSNEPSIIIHGHERVSLFCSTSIIVFPILYTVYEARDTVIKSGIDGNLFLEEIVKYVNFRGFIIKLLRRNNAFVMSIN